MDSSQGENQTLTVEALLYGGDTLKGTKNLKAITLYIYKPFFIIEPNDHLQVKTRLIIDRKTGRTQEEDLNEPKPNGYTSSKSYSAFLGILPILDKVFLLMCQDVQTACHIENKEVFQVVNVNFVPFDLDNEFYNAPTVRDILGHMQNIRKLLGFGHYFSYGYDLTLSKSKSANGWQTDMQFQWNRFLCQEFVKFQIDRRWSVPLIQKKGFLSAFTVPIQGKKVEYFLISRRSSNKPGTRYNTRGIDDDGNVANFVETEQIIYYSGYCCSFVQVRGSAPIFFQQRGMTAATRINRTFDLTNEAYNKHFEQLIKTYGYVTCINLMSKGKNEEQMITEAYEVHIKNNKHPQIRYEFFDFHFHTKGNRFDKVNPFLQKIHPLIERFKFFAQDIQTSTKLIAQEGVFRTNCLDCMDRTNFLQSKIGMVVMDLQMRQLGVDLNAIFGQDILIQLDNDNLKQQHPFVLSYKNIWADNGDYLSMHYAGTGSIISSVTRAGKKDFFGFIDHAQKSISRFYIGNFEDQVKQECIDILTGQHADTLHPFADRLEKLVREKEKEYTSYDQISVFLATWNLGGYSPSSNFDLSQLFNFEGNSAPDIIVVGFQEFVELNTTNILAGDQSKFKQWVEVLLLNLKKYDKYIFVKHQNLVGILLVVIVKFSLAKRLTRVDADVVKTGLAGTVGNKGGAIVKFYIEDTSFSFVNVHMEAGNKANKERLMNVSDIYNRAFQQGGVGKRKEEKIMTLDYKFFIGDTNFRISYGNNETRMLIDDYINFMNSGKVEEAKETLKLLLSYDQLNQTKDQSEILQKFKEGSITFLPTYKYDANSNIYDTSKKQRTPSWTDRILWSTDTGSVDLKYYTRREFIISDHRPVVAYFNVQVKKFDLSKKELITRAVYDAQPTIAKVLDTQDSIKKEEAAVTKIEAKTVEEGKKIVEHIIHPPVNTKDEAAPLLTDSTQDTQAQDNENPDESQTVTKEFI